MHKEVACVLLLFSGVAQSAMLAHADFGGWESRTEYEARMAPRLLAWDDHLAALSEDDPAADTAERWHAVYPAWRSLLQSGEAEWPLARRRFERTLRAFSHHWARTAEISPALP